MPRRAEWRPFCRTQEARRVRSLGTLAIVPYAAAAFGQGTAGALPGGIVHTSGAVVTGAEVQVRNISTNQVRSASSLGDGQNLEPRYETS